MNKVFVKIEGMSCNHCKETIRKELLSIRNIKLVNFKRHTAIIHYDGEISYDDIVSKVIKAGYLTDKSKIYKVKEPVIKFSEFIFIFLGIIFVLLSLKWLFKINIFNIIPTIDSSATYGLLFVTGLFTSIHCISMCGGINLYASMGEKRSFKRPLLYNLGRLTSYTLIGGIFGLLGSFFSINYHFQQIILLVAGIIMLLITLSMFGIINFNLNKLIPVKFKRIKTKNSYLIGLLNGFMPCGPLQAMQLYALGTGSFIVGALSLFMFSLGTIPLMLAVGVLVNLFKGKVKVVIQKISLVLILILSLLMINRALLGLGIDITKSFSSSSSYTKSKFVEDYQYIEFDLSYSEYQDIIIQENIPVKMVINVDKKYLTGCNNKIIIKEYGIEKTLEAGENIITFTPTKKGEFNYGCFMNMIKNKIKVIDDKDYFIE